MSRFYCQCLYLLQVQQGHASSDNVAADYCDSSHFKNHPLFSQDHRHLQIELYYDDVEFCNPLGAYRKKHKLGMFCCVCIAESIY